METGEIIRYGILMCYVLHIIKSMTWEFVLMMVYQSAMLDVLKGIGEKRKMETEVIRFKAKRLIRDQALIKEEVELSSGRKSDYYVKMSRVLNNPLGLAYITDLLYESVFRALPVAGIGGIALGGAPLVYGFITKWPGFFAFLIRTDVKTHGLKEKLELPSYARGGVVLMDDVITSGGSLLRGWEICKQHPRLAVVKAIVVVDRQEGGIENCAAEGLKVESLFTIDEILKE